MIELLIVLAVFGVALYLINTYLPMAAPVKTVINVIAVIMLLLFVLHFFGITDWDFGQRHRYRH